MIVGAIFASIIFVWLGGVAFTFGALGVQYATAIAVILTSLGSGWLGIIFAAMFRHVEEGDAFIRKITDTSHAVPPRD